MSRPGHGSSMLQPLVPLRDLRIANSSLLLARFNASMKDQQSTTYINAITRWRESGISALDFIHATWKPGDLPVVTRVQQLTFLAYGSPVLRFVFRLICKYCFRDPGKGHAKLILGEALPVTAWFLEIALQHAYIKVKVMHANLTQSERSELAAEFNDSKSTLKVLILLADVSIVGLNLHRACSTVFLTSIMRNLAQEIQLWGRAIRVSNDLSEKYFWRLTQRWGNLGRLDRRSQRV